MKGRADDAGPDEPICGPSELVDAVLALLEEAGTPTEMNDAVVKLIEAWEYSEQGPRYEPPEVLPMEYDAQMDADGKEQGKDWNNNG